MNQAPLSCDTINNPSLWRLSLMICDTALEVVLRRIVGEPELITTRITLNTSLSHATAIEESIYANPLLLSQFGKTDVVIRSDKFQIVPTEVASDADAVEAILDLLPHPDGRPIAFISNIDKHNCVATFVDRSVANFIARTFYSTKPISHLSALGRFFAHQSRLSNRAKMYVNLQFNSIDIIAYNSLGLTIANTLECDNDDNAVYYILAAGKASGFDFTVDEIFISGNSEWRASLMPTLRKFANYVLPTIFPSAAYSGDHHNALRAPFELITLPLCE